MDPALQGYLLLDATDQGQVILNMRRHGIELHADARNNIPSREVIGALHQYAAIPAVGFQVNDPAYAQNPNAWAQMLHTTAENGRQAGVGRPAPVEVAEAPPTDRTQARPRYRREQAIAQQEASPSLQAQAAEQAFGQLESREQTRVLQQAEHFGYLPGGTSRGEGLGRMLSDNGYKAENNTVMTRGVGTQVMFEQAISATAERRGQPASPPLDVASEPATEPAPTTAARGRAASPGRAVTTSHAAAARGDASVTELQQAIVDYGRATQKPIDLGSYGSRHDGVDGVPGPKTEAAITEMHQRLGVAEGKTLSHHDLAALLKKETTKLGSTTLHSEATPPSPPFIATTSNERFAALVNGMQTADATLGRTATTGDVERAVPQSQTSVEIPQQAAMAALEVSRNSEIFGGQHFADNTSVAANSANARNRAPVPQIG